MNYKYAGNNLEFNDRSICCTCKIDIGDTRIRQAVFATDQFTL